MGWGVSRKADPGWRPLFCLEMTCHWGRLAPVELGMHGSIVGSPSPLALPTTQPCTVLRLEGSWPGVWAPGWAYRAEPPGGQRGGSSGQIWQGRWQESGRRPHPQLCRVTVSSAGYHLAA